MRAITRSAPAKLNLTLDILGRRPDGFHEMRMVMQSISLADTVTVGTGTGTGAVTVSADRADLPAGPENIAWKAAMAFYHGTGIPNDGTEIRLEKRIPMQAGMAGGSADGAAVLRALRDLLAPELPDRELEKLAEQVGSDVPFCVRGGTALAEGRGERLTDLPPMPDCRILLCKPDFGLSTPALFGRVRTEALENRPDLPAVERALAAGDLEALARRLGNVFEQVLNSEERAAIRWIETQMLKNGALSAVMTGSGPTVFGLFLGELAARRAEHDLRARYSQIFHVRPLKTV